MSLSAGVLTQASSRQEQTVAVLVAFVAAGSEFLPDQGIFGTLDRRELTPADKVLVAQDLLKESDA